MECFKAGAERYRRRLRVLATVDLERRERIGGTITLGPRSPYSGSGVDAATGTVSASTKGTTESGQTTVATATVSVSLNGKIRSERGREYSRRRTATYGNVTPKNGCGYPGLRRNNSEGLWLRTLHRQSVILPGRHVPVQSRMYGTIRYRPLPWERRFKTERKSAVWHCVLTERAVKTRTKPRMYIPGREPGVRLP